MATSPAPVFSPGVRHEKTDANIRKLALFGLGLFFTLALTLAGMWGLFAHFAHEQERSAKPAAFETPRPLPPEPRLQPDPRADLNQYLTAQMRELSSYSWVDRQKGIVHIPIGRAMHLIVSRGLPVRSATEQADRPAMPAAPETRTAQAIAGRPPQ